MRGATMSLVEMLEMLRGPFAAEAQAEWFYEEDPCPCCRVRSLNPSAAVRSQVVSLNTFFYRPRALMILYPLCAHCGPRISKERGPGPMHRAIETNLVAAYNRFIAANES